MKHLLVVLIVIASLSYATGQMIALGDAIEGFAPCDDFVLSMERIIGGPPKLENYWDGTIYLDKWPHIRELRIGLTVDNRARIEINPDDGSVRARGNTFNINVWGHPPLVNKVKFKIRGEPKGAFPNVQKLTLNDQDVCQNPKKVSAFSHFSGKKKQCISMLCVLQWTPTILGSSNVAETQVETKEIPKCGNRLIQHQELITNGYPSKEGDWPWHAALYHTDNLENKYKCGGTLISSNLIITGE